MNKKIKAIFKGFIAIILLYFIQIIWAILFNKTIQSTSLLKVNLCLIGCELFLTIIFIILNYQRLKKDYESFNQNYKVYLKKGLTYWIIGLVIMLLSNIIISFITSGIAANEEMNRELLLEYPYYTIISCLFSAPIIEELVFRCSFKDAFKNKWSFVLFTSFIFAGAHVFNGFTSLIDLLYFIPYGALAISLGLAYYETDNIYTSILIHSFHNTLSVLQLLVVYAMLGL